MSENEEDREERLQLRTDDPEVYWESKTVIYWLWIGLSGYWLVTCLAFDNDVDLVSVLRIILCSGLMTISALLANQTKKRREREEKGRLAEHGMVQAIREAFGNDVIVDHRVQAGEQQDLDIFVRFPACQVMFAFSVKSWGLGKVVFNEKQGFLCFRRPANGGLSRKDAPDPLNEILDHEWWLRRNNRGIFGGSSRAAKKPVRKAIVFAKPTEIQRHRPHRYSEISNHHYVFCERGKSSIFLISEEQLIDFIKDNLAAELAKRPQADSSQQSLQPA